MTLAAIHADGTVDQNAIHAANLAAIHAAVLSAILALQHHAVSQDAQLTHHAAHQQIASHANQHAQHLSAHLSAQLVAADKVWFSPQVEMYSGSGEYLPRPESQRGEMIANG